MATFLLGAGLFPAGQRIGGKQVCETVGTPLWAWGMASLHGLKISFLSGKDLFQWFLIWIGDQRFTVPSLEELYSSKSIKSQSAEDCTAKLGTDPICLIFVLNCKCASSHKRIALSWCHTGISHLGNCIIFMVQLKAGICIPKQRMKGVFAYPCWQLGSAERFWGARSIKIIQAALGLLHGMILWPVSLNSLKDCLLRNKQETVLSLPARALLVCRRNQVEHYLKKNEEECLDKSLISDWKGNVRCTESSKTTEQYAWKPTVTKEVEDIWHWADGWEWWYYIVLHLSDFKQLNCFGRYQ